MSQPPADRSLNMWLGVGTLAFAVSVALFFALRPVFTAPEEPARRFLAFFENAGGINVGDVVRIKGRRAGRVTDATIVRRDGKTLVRVEFEISPGSGSQWLKNGAIPADSLVQVRVPALVGRPSLNVEIGKDGSNLIQEGGEWPRAKGVSGQDQFEKIHAQLTEFDQGLDKFVAVIADQELVDSLRSQVASIRLGLDELQARVQSGLGQTPDIDLRLEEASLALARLSADLKANVPEIGRSLERINEQTNGGPELAADAMDKLKELRVQVEKFGRSIEANAISTEGDALSKVFVEFRRMAATLRASSERGEANPKQFGSQPPWRLSRPYFNGGKTALEEADKAEAAAAHKHVELPMPPKPKPRDPDTSSGD